MIPDSEKVVELGGVRVTVNTIEELDEDGTALVTVLRDEVIALHLADGYVSERLVLSLAVAVALTLGGVYVGASLVQALLDPTEHVGRRAAYLLAACATTLGLGLLLAVRSLRRGPFVAVKLRSDQRKLAFRRDMTAEELARFIRALEESSAWEGRLGERSLRE